VISLLVLVGRKILVFEGTWIWWVQARQFPMFYKDLSNYLWNLIGFCLNAPEVSASDDTVMPHVLRQRMPGQLRADDTRTSCVPINQELHRCPPYYLASVPGLS